jgi:hypothetical protein
MRSMPDLETEFLSKKKMATRNKFKFLGGKTDIADGQLESDVQILNAFSVDQLERCANILIEYLMKPVRWLPLTNYVLTFFSSKEHGPCRRNRSICS